MSAFRLNKISHLESLSSVDSDGSEWNFIPGLHRICSKTSKTKSKIMTQLREVSEGLKMKMLQFPTLESLWRVSSLFKSTIGRDR